jgi:RHS repeat-associated protein
VTQYSYLGAGQGERVQEGSTTFENSALGISQSTNGATTTSYTRDSQGLVLDSHQPGGTGQFYVYDALGNVIGLLDHTGALHRTYKYGPAGGVSKDSGSSFDTAIRYRGAWNGAGNMYHFGARDYDPILREWTQVDPIDQPGDLRQSNWYVYAGNDPVNLLDTTGQSTLGDVAAGTGFGFAALACGTVTDGFGAGVCTAGLASGAGGIGVAGSGTDSAVSNGLSIGASATATVVGCATAETGVGAVACAGGIASLAGSIADLL